MPRDQHEQSLPPRESMDSEREEYRPGKPVSRTSTILWIFISVNMAWTMILLRGAFLAGDGSRFNRDVRNASTRSTLFDLVDLTRKPHTISGSIHPDGSLFRQPPSEAVDKAWSQVSFDGYELVNVTYADIVASNKDPSTRVRWSGSIDAYPAQIEFAHKIHCLNEIRKEIWGEHYFGELSIRADDEDSKKPNGAREAKRDAVHQIKTMQEARKIHRDHTMHCLHVLLQDLMCNVDVGIVTHNWIKVPGQPQEAPMPLADFSAVKQCRDFDAIADKVRSMAVPGGSEKLSSLRGSPGTNVLQTDDSYF